MISSFKLEELVRPNIRTLKPYHSAREDFEEGLLLDANENSLGAPFEDDRKLHRYPDPAQKKLRNLLAEWRGLRPENVFAGVGSDEAIDLLYRIFCRPGTDRVVTVPPTYGMYKVSAAINDIEVDEVLLEEDTFQPQVGRIMDTVRPETKLLFLCSPNNPTGNAFERERIAELVEKFPGLVILDEAYTDFSSQQSWAPQIATYPNLVVLQTLSKSFGLAGIRLGITFASEDVVNYMMKVKAPYNVNKLTAEKAIEGLQNWETVQFHVEAIKKERKKLREKLEGIAGVRNIYPSEANFLLVEIENARSVYERLAQNDVIVRYRGDEPHCEDCLRITVGTPDENERLIAALNDLAP